MRKPKRYELAVNGHEMLEGNYGEYVEHSDYLVLLESYEELLRIIKACDDLDCFSDLEPADMFDIKQAITNAEKLK